MPPDLLMPAFVVTLLANAILILVAMRTLVVHGDPDDRTPRPGPTRGTTRPTPTAIPDPGPRPSPSSSSSSTAD
jgi:hypothetical protein